MKGRFNPIANLILLATLVVGAVLVLTGAFVLSILIGIVGIYGSLSPRMLKEWERGVLLRLGRFARVLGPGINWTFPGFDRLSSTVDMRIRSTSFSAEKTLTKDTVPVNVDAVLFWVVTDAALMLTRADEPEIWLFPWHPDLVERRPWRPIKLRASWRELSASAEPIELDSLWHFDPWWELGHTRYGIHPLVPALKDTNIPGHDDSLTRFWFDRTLRRATWVARRGEEASELKRFSPARLSAADDTRRAARGGVVEQKRRGEWKLRPFWRGSNRPPSTLYLINSKR